MRRRRRALYYLIVLGGPSRVSLAWGATAPNQIRRHNSNYVPAVETRRTGCRANLCLIIAIGGGLPNASPSPTMAHGSFSWAELQY